MNTENKCISLQLSKKEYDAKYYKSNTEACRHRVRSRYYRDIEKIRNYTKEYWQKNKAKRNEYVKNRIKNNKNARIAAKLRASISSALTRKNASKTVSTEQLLGCSLHQARYYLECKFKEGMTWDNHGKWHIDHIIPVSFFNLNDIKEQKKACNFTNLQPLWAKENISKSNKIVDSNNINSINN